MKGSDRELIQQAVAARRGSYAPYSQFAVGAALLAADGTIYTGCNIENASYPLGNCAERTAVFAAVRNGVRSFSAIAIAGGPAESETLVHCPPCGACRQVLREFCAPEFRILYSDGAGGFTETTLAALLPDSFGPELL